VKSLAEVVAWQDEVVAVRVEARSMTAASTGLANETLNDTVAAIGRKIPCVLCRLPYKEHLKTFLFNMVCGHSIIQLNARQ